MTFSENVAKQIAGVKGVSDLKQLQKMAVTALQNRMPTVHAAILKRVSEVIALNSPPIPSGAVAGERARFTDTDLAVIKGGKKLMVLDPYKVRTGGTDRNTQYATYMHWVDHPYMPFVALWPWHTTAAEYKAHVAQFEAGQNGGFLNRVGTLIDKAAPMIALGIISGGVLGAAGMLGGGAASATGVSAVAGASGVASGGAVATGFSLSGSIASAAVSAGASSGVAAVAGTIGSGMVTSAATQLVSTGKVSLQQTVVGGVLAYGASFAGDYVGSSASKAASGAGASADVAAVSAKVASAATTSAIGQLSQGGKVDTKTLLSDSVRGSGAGEIVSGATGVDVVRVQESIKNVNTLAAVRESVIDARNMQTALDNQAIMQANDQAEINRMNAEIAAIQAAKNVRSDTVPPTAPQSNNGALALAGLAIVAKLFLI